MNRAGRDDTIDGAKFFGPPGDTLQPVGIVKAKQITAHSSWVLIEVFVRNQHDEKVAAGEAMAEFPFVEAV